MCQRTLTTCDTELFAGWESVLVIEVVATFGNEPAVADTTVIVTSAWALAAMSPRSQCTEFAVIAHAPTDVVAPVGISSAGSRSSRVAPTATRVPLFLIWYVIGNGVPTVPLGTEALICRSVAPGVTTVVTVATSAPDDCAVIEKVPGLDGVTKVVAVPVAPGARSPTLQVNLEIPRALVRAQLSFGPNPLIVMPSGKPPSTST